MIMRDYTTIVKRIYQYRNLIWQLTKREVASRYKGSIMGIVWSLITPMLMLLVYTFVFSVVFNAKWPGQGSNKIEFALLLFAGMIVYNVFAEVVSKAPTLIVNNSNYVKKVVFPLEILPIVTMTSSLIYAFISFAILLVGIMVFMHSINITIFLLPIVIFPIVLFSVGLSWVISSLGVYIRDVGHIVVIALQVVMFLSPIFYPIEAIPKEMRFIYRYNPIAYTVEDMRKIVVWGQLPNWEWLLIGTGTGLLVFIAGYIWFQKTRGGFADVL